MKEITGRDDFLVALALGVAIEAIRGSGFGVTGEVDDMEKLLASTQYSGIARASEGTRFKVVAWVKQAAAANLTEAERKALGRTS